MSTKTRILVVYGGQSAEHEISHLSAKNVIKAIDTSKYEVVECHIDIEGKWSIPFADVRSMDVVFPVLHGPRGEDGTVQGLLKLLNVPFVGSGALSSSLCMDKHFMKLALRAEGINVADWILLTTSNSPRYDELAKKLSKRLYVKPCNMGSSIGISRVENQQQLEAAIQEAFLYDTRILIEREVVGREIECAILGNETPKASLPGEIIPKDKFYSYEGKYFDEDGAKLEMPAKLSAEQTQMIQETALEAYKTLACEGMGRVDMFLTEDNQVYLNEINTIPGFTNISMYPKLWEVSGLSNSDLIDELIRLALERHAQEQKLKFKL